MKRRRWQASASFLLALAGLAVAAYLVYVHYQDTALICGLGDCEKVQTSSYAQFAGIPIAWFGLGLFAAILGLLVARETIAVDSDIIPVVLFALTFAGTLSVGYLTYLEIWVIEAICQWCVTFAVITVFLFVLSASRLVGLFSGSDESSAP